MQAIALERYGGPEELHPVELPAPKLPPDALLIRTRAAGVNPVDAKIRAGALAERFPSFFPLVPGWDLAGTVERVGPAVHGFAPGDDVIAYCRKDFIQEGAYADLVAVRATQATHKPRSLTFEHAAGLPLAGLTAYQAIYDGLRLQPGETVLIHRAAGGVGSFAVQLGRIVGAHVIATASRANHDYLRELGASECIDYHEEDPIEAVRASHPDGIDAVLDLVGGDTLRRSAEVLGRGGRLVSVIEPPDEEAFERRGAHASYLFVMPDGDELRVLAALADGGELRIRLEKAFPLGEARSAHERLEEGHVHGKLALMAEG